MNRYTIILNANDAYQSLSDTHKKFKLDDSRLSAQQHMLIGVQSFSMPYTFKEFTSSNNTFTISTYDGETTLSENITITEGTYTISELLSLLNTTFTSIKSNLGLTSMSINYNNNKNRCYLNIVPTMETLTISNILPYKQLGFTSSDDYVFSNASTFNYFPKCPDLSGPSSIYIRIHNKKIRTYNSKNVDGVLCNIPCNCWNTSIIYFFANNPQYHYAYGDTAHLELSVLDDNLDEITDLGNGGASYHITLAIQEIYE